MSSIAKKPGLLLSLFPVLSLIAFLVLNIDLFKDSALLGPNQIALFIAAVIATFIGIFILKVPYKDIEEKVIHSIGLSMQANLILLVVGMLIGLWIFSGVVPAMIYYGIKIFNPTLFLPLTCIVCAVVSLATGSSWSTGGTVGIALIGVGQALGIPTSMVAGAVISGAYFGDKLSPLSDTTNLAPAMAGTDLFTHVRYMLFTTVPSIIIALIGFTILGFFYGGSSSDLSQVNVVMETIDSIFNITPFLFILPLFVFVLVAKRTPALPALILGCLVGAVFVLIFQQELLRKMLGDSFGFKSVYGKLIEVAHGGFKMESDNEVISSLLTRGGMSAMLNTVWIILMSMVFGGVMEVTGMLEVIGFAILKMVRGTASLIAATVSSAFFVNLTAGDQYLSIVLPGRMFKPTFEKFNLAPRNLSRSLEDAGTITSVLVPWNTCGAYFSTILGVSTGAYLPFCFFNLINPFMAILIAAFGFKIEKLSESGTDEENVAVVPNLG
ncbi:MAG: Na+/H+ antiporter NhaC [Bacteriovoracia bacterium]